MKLTRHTSFNELKAYADVSGNSDAAVFSEYRAFINALQHSLTLEKDKDVKAKKPHKNDGKKLPG